MLKNYIIIQLPNKEKKINELNEREAKEFFQWFINIIPERLKMLKSSIESNDKRIASKLDFSPNSLIYLGEWFSKNISTRKRTKKEIRKEKSMLIKFPGVKPKSWTLTGETMSLCFDIGIYLGTVFTKKFPEIKWTYVTKPKNYINRNWPLLNQFRVNWSPIRAVTGFVYGLLNGDDNSNGLKKIYNYGVKELEENWRKRGKTWIYIGPKKYQKHLMEWEKIGKK